MKVKHKMPKDVAEAVKYYRKAAEGFTRSQYRLGWRYGDGKGVPKDKVEAAKWYSRSSRA